MLWGLFSLGFVYSDMMILCWLCNAGRRRQPGQWNCSRSCLPTYGLSLCSPYCTSSRRHASKHVIAPSKPEFVLTGPGGGGGGGATALSYCSRREQRENDTDRQMKVTIFEIRTCLLFTTFEPNNSTFMQNSIEGYTVKGKNTCTYTYTHSHRPILGPCMFSIGGIHT